MPAGGPTDWLALAQGFGIASPMIGLLLFLLRRESDRADKEGARADRKDAKLEDMSKQAYTLLDRVERGQDTIIRVLSGTAPRGPGQV